MEEVKNGRLGFIKNWWSNKNQKDQAAYTSDEVSRAAGYIANTFKSLKALLKLKRIFDCTLDELVDPENHDELGKKKEKVKRYKLVRCSE